MEVTLSDREITLTKMACYGWRSALDLEIEDGDPDRTPKVIAIQRELSALAEKMLALETSGQQ